MLSLRLLAAVCALGAASACGSGSTPSSPTPTTGGGTPIVIPSGAQSKGSAAYAPDTLTVAVGTTVAWTNTDAISHTVTSDTSAFNSGTLGPNAAFTFTFQNAGTFAYHCAIHPGMVGSVVVQ
jgi:plastocyanin